jgi:hypothetical protein
MMEHAVPETVERETVRPTRKITLNSRSHKIYGDFGGDRNYPSESLKATYVPHRVARVWHGTGNLAGTSGAAEDYSLAGVAFHRPR